MIVNWKWYSTDHDDHIEVHGHQVAFQLFFWLPSSSGCAKSFLPVSSLKTNDCATQRAFSIWIFNFPKIFCKGKESDLKSCLRNVKCALQAVQWSRRSRLSRGFDFSAPRRLFRVLRELDRRTFDDSAETPDRGKISLWKNLFIKEFVGLHWFESTNHYKKVFFFLQNLSPCSILFWQFRRLWTHSFSFNALKNAGG